MIFPIIWKNKTCSKPPTSWSPFGPSDQLASDLGTPESVLERHCTIRPPRVPHASTWSRDVKRLILDLLVVCFYPSEKYEFVNWDEDIPNMSEK